MSQGNQANGLTEQKKRKKIKQSLGGNEEGGGEIANYNWSRMETVDVEPLSWQKKEQAAEPSSKRAYTAEAKNVCVLELRKFSICLLLEAPDHTNK